jgi:signal transduction histidine kinase/CheY-like chemotaxis protein
VDRPVVGLDAPRDLLEEVLQLLARQARRVPLAIAFNALFMAAMLWPHAPVGLVVAWTAAVIATQALRRVVLVRLPASPGTSVQRLRRAGALAALNGVVLASSVAFFPVLPDLHRAVISLLLAGLSTGSVATTGGHPLAYRAFAVPMMVALILGWGFAPRTGSETWLHGLMSLLALLYLLILLALANDTYRTLHQSVESHNEQLLLNEQLRQALNSARNANAAKSRFLAAASHDLRQPLHTLTLFCATLRSHRLPEASNEVLHHMDTALDALRSQLMALLDISKLDAGVVDINPRPVSLQMLLGRFEREFRPLASAKGLALSCTVDEDLTVLTDPLQFERMLGNLLENAIKYTGKGSVQVAAGALPDGRVQLTVRDTGRGIAAENQERVFEEFFQVDNPERDRSRGLGLGLAIVQRLSVLLDVPVRLESAIGVGSTFRLTLRPAAEAATCAPEAPAPLSALPSCHALVLDDEEGVRFAMKALLESMNCRVTLASTTEEAVGLAALETPDLVLSDFRLRGDESGIEAIRRLRQAHPGLPALLISGDTARARLHEARAAGLTLLHKPLSAHMLLGGIIAALNEPGG